jgi:hypothetical protein
MSDYDDEEDYSPPMKMPKMKMPGIGSLLMCTPLKIYLAVAFISVIIYYANSIFKGKWPDGNSASSFCCGLVCLACILMFTCKNFILAWILAIGFSVCAICFAMGKISIPKI